MSHAMRISQNRFSSCWVLALVAVIGTACTNPEPTPSQPTGQPITSAQPTASQPKGLPIKVVVMEYRSGEGNSPFAVPPIVYKNTSYAYARGNQTIYQYDNQGRLTLRKYIDVNYPDSPYSSETSSYTYDGNKVLFQGKRNTQTYVINEKGHVSSPDGYYLYADTKYEYDQQGFLVNRTSPNRILLQEINTGNVTKRVETSESSAIASRQESSATYEYDLSRPAMAEPLPSYNLGTRSKNLITKSIIREISTGVAPYANSSSTHTYDYTYAFDEQGRVSQQTLVETIDYPKRSTESYITVTLYTYAD